MARTNPGMGPKKDDDESGARPAPREPSIQIAEPPPRPVGKSDTVDAILEGFGDRPERPRVKVERHAEMTPVPSPEPPKVVQKHVSTSPGQRQQGRREMGYVAITIAVLVGVVGFVFYVTRGDPQVAPAAPVPTDTPVATTAQTIVASPTTAGPIAPTAVEPTAAAPTAPPTTARTAHPTAHPTAKASAAPPASAAAAPAPTPKPTGSAPPGFNLLKDKASTLE